MKFLSRSFHTAYSLGFLKNNRNYQFNYFIKRIIKKGDYVVDLGANLGYFAKIFSNLVGKSGKVICIEPVKPFFQVLKESLGSSENVVLYNYALGTERKFIKMFVPALDGYLRTGLAHVPSDESELESAGYAFEVEMMKGSELLRDLPRLDYIKCDIEGYEEYVLPELKQVIERFKPVIQVETAGTHKEIVFGLLLETGYDVYRLVSGKLSKDMNADTYSSDYLFIHKDNYPSNFSELV